MALAPCRECGKDVATSARQCPHCGVEHPTSRSILTTALIGLLILITGFWILNDPRKVAEIQSWIARFTH